MLFSMKQSAGFTIIELIIVVSILAIMAGVTISGFLNYVRYQQYQATVATVTLELSQVQAEAKVALQDENHGFNVGTDRITFYTGDFYNALDTTNEVVVFDNVRFIPTLTNGVTDVRLGKVTGLPSATGTIEIVGTGFAATTTITLTKAGVLYYE